MIAILPTNLRNSRSTLFQPTDKCSYIFDCQPLYGHYCFFEYSASMGGDPLTMHNLLSMAGLGR